MSMKQEQFRIVSVLDPAIDTENMPMETMQRYIETRDEKLITPYIRPGGLPTWFHIREIPRRLMTRFVQSAAGVESMRNDHAFRAGVVLVENVHQEDGPHLVSWKPPRTKDDVLPEDVVEQRFSPAEVDEVGCVIWHHSFLARKMRRTFPLPHTSLEALSARVFLRVAASPSLPATSSDEASLEASPALAETETTSSTSDGSCVSPMDATATEMQSTAA